VEQIPVTGNPMQPQSGTYGRVAETDRLKQALNLPGGSAPGSGGPAGPPPMTGQPPGGAAVGQPPPSGVPDVLLAPTSMPDVPQSTPLASPYVSSPTSVTAAQRRISVLQALSTSDTVSEETREWAATVLEKLASRSRG
jgi:hypothetical protein